MSRRAPWIWAGLIVPLWVTLILCTHWEPVVRDGWTNVLWHIWHDVDAGSVWRLFREGWLGSNPRLGQTVTTLMYTPGPYHAMFTPLLELALFGLLTMLALGRRPSLRRTDDALAFATVVALVAVCTPQFGPMLFYRPYTGNYTFGLVLNLVWLIPYRLHALSPRPWRGWAALAMLVLGLTAGLCNEHTGPAFFAAGACATTWAWRRERRLPAWMIAGLVGLVVGYLGLMLAPGHALRYGGLATQAGVVERIVERGVGGNARVLGLLALYLAGCAPWLALGLLARRARARALDGVVRASLAVLAGTGLVCTLTLLGSPKLGPRLYLASIALIACALTGWLVLQLGARWARWSCALLSCGVLGYVLVRCILTYAAVGPVGAERLRVIVETPDWESITLRRYPVAGGRWFLGEDLDAPVMRKALQADHALGGIELVP